MRRHLGGLDLDLIESILNGLTDSPCFVKDAGHRYVAANRAMVFLVGARTRDDMIGKTARDFFPAALVDRYEAFDEQVLSTGIAITDRLDLAAGRRGRPTWLLFSRTPVRDEDGEVVGLVATARALGSLDARHPMHQRLAMVVEQIEANLEQALNLAGLARLAGVSASQLERDFAQVFRITLTQFHHKTRIDRALRLLRTPVPIAEVAQACGYADQSAFARRFKAMTGVTPGQYRRGQR